MQKEIEKKTSEQAKDEIKNAINTLSGFVTDLIDEVLRLEEQKIKLQQELDKYIKVAEGKLKSITYKLNQMSVNFDELPEKIILGQSIPKNNIGFYIKPIDKGEKWIRHFKPEYDLDGNRRIVSQKNISTITGVDVSEFFEQIANDILK